MPNFMRVDRRICWVSVSKAADRSSKMSTEDLEAALLEADLIKNLNRMYLECYFLVLKWKPKTNVRECSVFAGIFIPIQ